LLHYDCKTDVDDLQSVAAFATLQAHGEYAKLKFHAVAGTYGMQEGLYVPAEELFRLAFKDNWSDAHDDYVRSIEIVSRKVLSTLKNKGDNIRVSVHSTPFLNHPIRNHSKIFVHHIALFPSAKSAGHDVTIGVDVEGIFAG